MELRFAKMHGLGNDFMVVDLVSQRAEPTAAQIRAWADRRTGIGFDQFLAVLPPDDPDVDFRHRIFNADGSEAEHCGNGVRCLAHFVREGLTSKRKLRFETSGGSVLTQLQPNGDVEVDMGVPDTPLSVCQHVDVDGRRVDLTPVSMGNPHAVIFVDDVESAAVHDVGAGLQRHRSFPHQVNVGFLQIVDRGSGRLRVYERGVGETRACGSGACAAMVAGRLHDRFDERVQLALPGGTLWVAWSGPGETAALTGGAQFVYKGKVAL